jgi:hypothetical protein
LAPNAVAAFVYLLAMWATASPFALGITMGIDLIIDSAAQTAFATATHSPLNHPTNPDL